MTSDLKSEEIRIEYTESEVVFPDLWENHCHTQYEVIAVEQGDITVLLEGQNYRLQKNQVLIVPPLFYHSVTANQKGVYRRITALVDPDVVPAVLRPEFAKRGRVAAISSSDIERIRSIGRGEKTDFYAPLLRSLIVCVFYDALEDPQPLTGIGSDDFLQKTISYIDEHLHEKILLDDLAAHTARSKSSFCHLFREKMKISPKQYILQKKLAMAKKSIDEGIPHTLAAMRIGYDNYGDFYRLYCKNFPDSVRGKGTRRNAPK